MWILRILPPIETFLIGAAEIPDPIYLISFDREEQKAMRSLYGMRLVMEWILLTAMSSRTAHPKTELNRATEAVHAT